MKLKIRIIVLGHIPHSININTIKAWKSNLFEIHQFGSLTITNNSDAQFWVYSDKNIEQLLPKRTTEDILVAVTNVPLENNYFARRYSDNKICMTYHTMSEILKSENIPLENLLFRVLYSASLVYKRYENRIPLMTENTNFTHDETRSCIFDMNGIKTDIIYSLNKPQLCLQCIQVLTDNRIEKEQISNVQRELKRIKKKLYFRIISFVQRNPILAIIISSVYAIILGILGTIIYEKLLK